MEKEKEHTRADNRKGKGAFEREYGRRAYGRGVYGKGKEHTRGEYGKGKGAYKSRIRKRKRSIQEDNREKE